MRVCEITGKKAYVAYQISHAHNRSKKHQQPNLQEKRIFVPETGGFVKLTLSTRAIRTVNKVGLRSLCKQYDVDYDAVIARAH